MPNLGAVHSPFWGQKPVIALFRGNIKRRCFWPKKRHGENVPWKTLFSPKTNFGTSPHPPGLELRVESRTTCFYAQHHGLTLNTPFYSVGRYYYFFCSAIPPAAGAALPARRVVTAYRRQAKTHRLHRWLLDALPVRPFHLSFLHIYTHTMRTTTTQDTHNIMFLEIQRYQILFNTASNEPYCLWASFLAYNLNITGHGHKPITNQVHRKEASMQGLMNIAPRTHNHNTNMIFQLFDTPNSANR